MEAEWDAFVEVQSLNGTILHTRNFYNHNPKNAEDEHSFVFMKKDKIIALLPAVLYKKEGKRILHSHLRATYGGFIVSAQTGVAEAIEIVNVLITYCKKLEVSEIVIRNPFRIFNKQFTDETDYGMWYHGFTIKSREIETAIALGDYDTVRISYSDTTVRNVKKSMRYISVGESTAYKEYWDILEQNLIRKYGVHPTHSYEQFQVLINNVGNDKIKLFVAETDNQMVGGIIIFIANDITLHAQYIASNENYQEYRPLNALIDCIIKWGCENGYKYLNLGTSNSDAGREINSGLFRFKEGFGGRGVLRETMHLVL